MPEKGCIAEWLPRLRILKLHTLVPKGTNAFNLEAHSWGRFSIVSHDSGDRNRQVWFADATSWLNYILCAFSTGFHPWLRAVTTSWFMGVQLQNLRIQVTISAANFVEVLGAEPRHAHATFSACLIGRVSMLGID